MVAAQTAGRCSASPKRSRFTFLGEQERERETIWRRQAKAGPGWCGMTRDYHDGARAGGQRPGHPRGGSGQGSRWSCRVLVAETMRAREPVKRIGRQQTGRSALLRERRAGMRPACWLVGVGRVVLAHTMAYKDA